MGSVVSPEGREITEVYFLLEGMVTVGLYGGTDPDDYLYISGPGTVVDMCALLDPPISPVTVRALTDVEVQVIPREGFVQMVKSEPSLGSELLRELSTRLSLITRAVGRLAPRVGYEMRSN